MCVLVNEWNKFTRIIHKKEYLQIFFFFFVDPFVCLAEIPSFVDVEKFFKMVRGILFEYFMVNMGCTKKTQNKWLKHFLPFKVI